MNPYKEKIISGFSFIKVGEFYNNKEPILVNYEGKDVPITLSLSLDNDEFKKTSESTYLIISDNQLMYVGEYAYNLADRWLRNGEGEYVWHHKDNDISNALKEKKKVTLWVVRNPYIKIDKQKSINISKSIESEVLKQYDVPWNTRGKTKKYEDWIKANCIKLEDLIK